MTHENSRRLDDAALPADGRAEPGPPAAEPRYDPWRDRVTGGGQPASDLASASAPADRRPGEDLRERQDRLLDEAVEETFPASDPISPKRIT